MNDIKNNVAKNIVSLRQAERMTQLDLAERINYSDKAVSKWERAEAMPDISTLVDIADIFGVSLDYLVRAEHTAEEIKKESQKSGNAKPKYNHTVITGVSIILVWFIALFTFVMMSLLSKNRSNAWVTFVYAVPVSAIVWLVFNSVWFNSRINYFIISILMWSLLAAMHITFLLIKINILPIYLLGIPGQIIILMWSFIKRKNPDEAQK